MGDSSPDFADQNKKVEAAQQWLHQNGNNISGIEQKLGDEDSAGVPARTLVIKRKAKKKDDGPLELFCGWIVENQIGRSELPRL